MSLFRLPPFTPAMRRVQMAAHTYYLVMAWDVFPLVLIAVYVASFVMIGRDPGFAGRPLPIVPVIVLAVIFVAMMALFWAIGRYALTQIRRMKAGEVPWPWPREG